MNLPYGALLRSWPASPREALRPRSLSRLLMPADERTHAVGRSRRHSRRRWASLVCVYFGETECPITYSRNVSLSLRVGVSKNSVFTMASAHIGGLLHWPKRTQLSLPFLESNLEFPALDHRLAREAIIRERQPRRFPPGWFALSLADPDWRAKHYAAWSKRRKAMGRPHVVLDQDVA
jgi:hypothetical protein